KSEGLKGKLLIDLPNVATAMSTPVISLLPRHTIETSDLVCVFSDVFDTDTALTKELIKLIAAHQDTNKFVYLIDEPTANLNTTNNNAIISLWQRKLSELGLDTGQFIVLTNQQNSTNPSGSAYFAEIDHRMTNVAHGRSYRVLDALEKNISDIAEVVIPETQKGISAWKDRVNMTTLIVLGFIASFAVLAEIEMGILEFLIDPIIGPAIGAGLLAVMIPIHLLSSKIQGRLIAQRLAARQKELHVMENLGNFFEKNLTFGRMMFSVSDPVGWNKKTKARLLHLREQTEELVQSLNDYFSSYQEPSVTSQPSNFKEFP
ncbi:MAG: hypothetical protein PHU14_00520, partial [Methylovulum sp.]|nr:hypothetical protein [Methylovulum sp.]